MFKRMRKTVLPFLILALFTLGIISRVKASQFGGPVAHAQTSYRFSSRVTHELAGLRLFLPMVRISIYSIHGHVWDNANHPLQGVTITAREGITTTTGADGSYAFRLAAGTYSLAPTLFYKPFVPITRQVILSADISSGLDFTCMDCSLDPSAMVTVPAGNFRMGCSPRDMYCDSDEHPLHTVYLSAYTIDRYEVTNGRYAACVTAGECTPPQEAGSISRASYYGNAAYASYPVINVDWNQAGAFCQWEGKRLPTEAEWEKAARGSSEMRIYAWGDAPADCTLANFYGRGAYCVGDTAPVGSFPLGGSQYGAMDLAGNVWEWVSDWYLPDFYTSQAVWTNPAGPALGTGRVRRGGGWDGSFFSLRASTRMESDPAGWNANTGFRCVRSR